MPSPYVQDMKNRSKIFFADPGKLINSIVIILFFLSLYWVWAKAQVAVDVPYACDPFGYMRQAQLFITEGYWHGLHTQLKDPSAHYLLDLAKSASLGNLFQSIFPYCHGYNSYTDQIILQYPPGTGFFFSLLPTGMRNLSTIIWAGFGLSLFFMTMSVAIKEWKVAAFNIAAAFASLYFLLALSEPLSNAVSGTIITMLATVLFLFNKKDLLIKERGALAFLAGLLFGILIDVRLPNALLFPGLLILLYRRTSLSDSFGFCFIAGLGALISAMPTLMANEWNAGGWLHSTYQSHDASLPTFLWEEIKHSTAFYFTNRKIRPEVLVLFVGIAFCWGRAKQEALAAFATIAINLLYFCSHARTAPYYLFSALTFSTTLITIGLARSIATNGLDVGAEKFKTALIKTSLGLPILAFALLALSPDRALPLLPDTNQVQALRNGIIWTNLGGGYFVNYIGTTPGNMTQLPQDKRLSLINKVRSDYRDQYFIQDGPEMETLIKELSSAYSLQPEGKIFGWDYYKLGSQR